MTISQLETLIARIRANPQPENPTVEFKRTGAEDRAKGLGSVPDAMVEKIDVSGVPAAWIAAPGIDERRAILYLHGGGFMFGSLTTHKRIAYDLSAASAARVLLLDYRLAPEHPFPAAFEDTLKAWHWLARQGLDPRGLAMAGDSAGGSLVIAAMVKLRAESAQLPVCAALVSPWIDLEASSESLINRSSRDPIVQKRLLLWMAHLYLKGADPKDPCASPIRADLRGLPPTLVQVGTAETLFDDSIQIAERLHAAGVKVKLSVWPNMIHVWPMFTPFLSEGREACAEIGDFIKANGL